MKIKHILIILIVGLLIGLFHNRAYAAEKDYQIPWCKSQNGKWESPAVTIRDQFTGKVEGFVDCITATHAIEVDFDYKWKEAFTQALWYSINTGKKAGILLIITRNSKGVQHTGEKKLIDLINSLDAPIYVWTVEK